MKQTVVEIKKPCQENMNAMIRDATGRFCSVCQVSVIDFTKKTPDEILAYFSEHKNETVCGSYNSWNVKTGDRIYNFLSYLHSRKLRFLALFISAVLLLAGCKTKKYNTRTNGARYLDEKKESIENLK